MPTANTFQAKGKRNGFPYCLEKKDVSDFAFVEPLTLDQAMNIWWNIYSLSGSAISTDYEEECPIPNLASKPIDRSCKFAISNSEFTGRTSIKVSTSVAVKMYNGDTEDENNFIGYGLGSSDFISSVHSMVFLQAQSFVGVSELGIASFHKTDDSGTSTLFGTISYSTVTLAGLPFVQMTRQQGTASSVSLSSVELYTYS
tara:strand:- start:1414 stop:2013 length:600 start_codon:yes stop_codon:yes gene_type:complete